jgi:hypothetical protein
VRILVTGTADVRPIRAAINNLSKMKFVIAALIGLTSAVPVTRILTDEGYVFMATEAVHKLNVKSKDYDKPSEYLCDGDKADDKEIQDAADGEDTIVEDFGFSGSRNARG